MKKRNSIILLICLGFVILLSFGIFVWPTRYRYTQMKLKDRILPVKIDRLTGRTEILGSRGWSQLETPSRNKELPSSELAKLTWQASTVTISSGRLECDIYNGSSWTILEITLKITVKNPNGSKVLARKYRLTPKWPLSKASPLQSSTFSTDLGFDLTEGQTWSWRIVSAKGHKE